MTGTGTISQNASGQDQRPAPSIDSSLLEYGRGIAGGLIFSLPLLYTMEVWWTGFIAEPRRLLVYVLASFVLLLGYNRYAGLHHDANWKEVVIDSVEEMGIGLVLAALFLFLLGRFTLDMHLSEIIGKLVMEGMTVAIGVSVGTAQLGGGGTEDDSEEQDDEEAPYPPPDPRKGHSVLAVSQIVVAFCAAMLIGGNIAPTEEILQIALEISGWSMVGLVIVSLLIGVLILFFSEFPRSRALPKENRLIIISSHGLATYAVALAAAAASLWFFGRFDDVSFITALAQTIVLGVATTLGASAGRLLLQ